MSKLIDAYNRTNGICFICGKPLPKNEKEWSVDHFIPQAIYKWTKDKEAKELIRSNENLFIVHAKCNYSKDSALPTKKAISQINADNKVKKTLNELHSKVQESVDEYRSIKQKTFALQDNKCAICGKALTLNNSTLRRINNNKNRSAKNAMCLCMNCNTQAGSSSQKNKMTVKAQDRNVKSKSKALATKKHK